MYRQHMLNFKFMHLYTVFPLHYITEENIVLFFLLHYICMTALVPFQITIFILFLSTENSISPNVVGFLYIYD